MRKEAKRDRRPGRGPGRRPSRGAHRSAIGGLLLASAICLLASGATPELRGPAGANVDTTRAKLEQWVKTRRIISKERRDWALAKEMLDERIGLVQHEIEALRGKITEADKSIAEADKKRAARVEQNEKLKEAAAALSGTVVALERRTRRLLHQLPDPVRERVRPLSQRLPKDPEDTQLSLGERFQNVVGILNEVNKFNRDITVTSELQTLPDGTTKEVTTLYVGIGQAYYVSADGTAAGVGTASPDGWVWTPANHAAPRINQAIAILKNEQVASFVRLPIKVQ